ncbi:MAG: hypothetical protein IPK87_17145 [Planctomycetes bacterium]|nr:hypothetical protein [Planctomycetota bacterium]
MESTVDPEIQALTLVGRAFESLTDTDARLRVVNWAIEKYGISAGSHTTPAIVPETTAQEQVAQASSVVESNKAKRPRGAKADKPSLKHDLTFHGSGEVMPPLREFFSAKFPTGQASHPAAFAVIAHWLKEVGGTEECGIDEMYTAYRWLKLKMPKVWAQAFRDGKTKLGFFDDGGSKGCYRLTHIGEDAVIRGELGKGSNILGDIQADPPEVDGTE